MSIEQDRFREDLARDAADMKQAEREQEYIAQFQELFCGDDGDIREILKEMADSESRHYQAFMTAMKMNWHATAKEALYAMFNEFAQEYVERNMRDGE